MTTDHTPALAAEVQEPSALEPQAQAVLAPQEAQIDTNEAAKFWSGVYLPEGMTAGEVKAELSDYHFLLKQVPKIYEAVSGGRLSKTNYYASVVIGCFEDYLKERVEEEVAEALEASAPPPVAPAPAEPRRLSMSMFASVADYERAMAAVPARNEPHEPLGVAAAPPGSTLQTPSGSSTSIPNAEESSAESWNPRNLLRKANVLRGKGVTCPAGRHVVILAENLLRRGYPVLRDDPEHAASSMLATVVNLWELRLREGSSPDRAETEGLGSEGLEPGAAGTRPEADAATQPLRQPLTEAEIDEVQRAWIARGPSFFDRCGPVGFARAIEAAHGITTRSPKP